MDHDSAIALYVDDPNGIMIEFSSTLRPPSAQAPDTAEALIHAPSPPVSTPQPAIELFDPAGPASPPRRSLTPPGDGSPWNRRACAERREAASGYDADAPRPSSASATASGWLTMQSWPAWTSARHTPGQQRGEPSQRAGGACGPRWPPRTGRQAQGQEGRQATRLEEGVGRVGHVPVPHEGPLFGGAVLEDGVEDEVGVGVRAPVGGERDRPLDPMGWARSRPRRAGSRRRGSPPWPATPPRRCARARPRPPGAPPRRPWSGRPGPRRAGPRSGARWRRRSRRSRRRRGGRRGASARRSR